MDPNFWHARWQANQIGFHQSTVNGQLARYASDLTALASKPRVLVPLCGKSLDMVHLRALGFSVVGIELSAIASRAFFEEQGLVATVRKRGKLESYSVEGLEILCGDFFDADSETLGEIQAVYDRAALVALPESLRRRYSKHLASLLGQGAPMLLVSFEYPQEQMSGPPFSVSREEVEALYGSEFGIKSLEDNDILQQNPQFAGRLSSLREHTYLLTRRGSPE